MCFLGHWCCAVEVLAVVVRQRSKRCSEATVPAGHLEEDLRVLGMLVPDERFKKEKKNIGEKTPTPLILRGHLSGKAVVRGCSFFRAGILRAV